MAVATIEHSFWLYTGGSGRTLGAPCLYLVAEQHTSAISPSHGSGSPHSHPPVQVLMGSALAPPCPPYPQRPHSAFMPQVPQLQQSPFAVMIVGALVLSFAVRLVANWCRPKPKVRDLVVLFLLLDLTLGARDQDCAANQEQP